MANLTESAVWETGVYMLEKTDPVVGGPDGIDNKPLKQLANRTLYLKGQVDSLGNVKANVATVITAGSGLTGGGSLAANRTIALGTPSDITSSSANSVSSTSHTHALDNTGVPAGTYRSVTVDVKGRVTAGNPVQVGLITATTATGTANQATGNSNTFLNVYEKVGSASSSVGTSTQVTGTGYASVSSDTNGKLSINVTVPAASTTRRGEVQLIDSVENNSTSTAATPNSVRVAYNKGVEALTRADGLATSKLDVTANAVSASKWATPRRITLAGAVSGSAVFDGSGDFTVNTTDNTVISLVTSTTSTGTTNVATSNSNTYLNVVETVNGVANATGSSTKVEGSRGITVSSDTGGKLIIYGMPYSNAVNSTRSDYLATSAAVKTAYDKGVEALNVANAKQSPATTLAGYGITDLAVNNNLNTTDLNTLRTVGIYGQPSNAEALAERNYPTKRAGSLLVLPSAYGYMQIYTTFDTGEQYVRNLNSDGTTWSAWLRTDGLNKLGLSTGGYVQGVVTLKDYFNINDGSNNLVGRIGQGSTDIYFRNMRSGGGILQLKNTGELKYNNVNVALETSNVASATKLQTPRTITLTGSVSGSTTFDGSGNVSIATTDNLTISLVTSTSATGVSNVATTNTNTYINAVEKRGSSSNSVGSSTRVTGRNGISVSSDTSGVLYIDGPNDIPGNSATSNKLAAARTIALTGAVTGSTTFDGSGNVSIATTDNLTISLVTSSSSSGTTNTSTGNTNTYLNVVETRGGTSNSLGSSTKLVGSGNISVSSSTSGIVTIYGKDSDLVKIVSSIPTSKSNDVICVSSMRRDFYWMTIGAFTGYASAELGHGVFSSSKNPLPGTVLADGRTLAVASYKALYEYAKANGLMVASSAWVQGSFWFVDLGNGNFKIPDMRGQFIRAVGPDADNANVMMTLGSYKTDTFKRHSHLAPTMTGIDKVTKNDGYEVAASIFKNGDYFASSSYDYGRAAPTTSEGSAETAPRNTALNYYIYVY